MNVIYIAQFHETCGYSHAAIGYLKSISENISNYENINFKILSVSLNPNNLNPQKYNSKISTENLDMIDRFHFKTQKDLDDFLEKDYVCLWHMTSVFPLIEKQPNAGRYYNELNCSLENIIIGSIQNYHILAWETDTLPLEYTQVIKNYNTKAVFAPSKWNQQTFKKSNFNSILLPHLIEEIQLQSTKIKIPDYKEKFVIFSVSEWTNRKNFQCLIKSYLLEFAGQKDVMLILKTSLPAGLEKDQFIKQFSHIKNRIRTHGKEKPNIVVILDYLEESKMKFLYEVCDVFCLTSLGEGFSLPTSEAAILKKPVICPRFGGHIDFLNKNNKYFIDGIWDTVIDSPPYDPNGKWFVPTIDSTRSQMRKAYTDWTNQNIESEGDKNYESSSNAIFSRKNICSTIFKSIENIPVNTSLTSRLKRKIKNKNLKDQMRILENQYLGEECYILNCGPSLLEHDPEKLKLFLKDKLTFTVKQAFNVYKDISNFHFFNCSNLPNKENYYDPHYENKKEVISVASSNYDEYTRWSLTQTSDIFFKIPIRTEINNEFLVRTSKITENLIKNNLTRPCGPGIMYETVLFMALHLGVKKINCIGWDLTSQSVNVDNYKHFYGNTENLINRGDILPWEIEETRNFSDTFYTWCLNNKIELSIISEQSSLSKRIPRKKLEL